MVVSRLCSHSSMVFVPLWIHDDGLVRVTDVDELQAKVDEGVGDIEKCDGAKVDDLSGVRERLRLRRCFSLERASGDVEYPYF